MSADTLWRPYDTTAIRALYDTHSWARIPPRYVVAEGLRPTHEAIGYSHLVQLARARPHLQGTDPAYPHIVAHEGVLWIHDGHHRVTLHRLERPGAVLLARVVDELGRPA